MEAFSLPHLLSYATYITLSPSLKLHEQCADLWAHVKSIFDRGLVAKWQRGHSVAERKKFAATHRRIIELFVPAATLAVVLRV